jgi:hypothetical protein
METEIEFVTSMSLLVYFLYASATTCINSFGRWNAFEMFDCGKRKSLSCFEGEHEISYGIIDIDYQVASISTKYQKSTIKYR